MVKDKGYIMAGKNMSETNIPDRVVRMELISYFSLYPNTVATCEETALRLSRDSAQVERQMEALVQLGILRKVEKDAETCYSYQPPLSVSSRAVNREAEQKHLSPYFVAGANINGNNGKKRSKRDEEKEGETDVRLQLMIAALKTEGWQQCLELLLDLVYRAEGAPCAAYLLGERCSEMLWDCQRGSNGTKAGMSKIAGVQNMVIEGELIRDKGLLDTPHYIKYLYPMGDDEDALICVCRKGSYHIDIDFLRSLFIDILPVVAEKRRLDLMDERTAEKLLQESIYWNTLHSQDVSKGLVGALASVAKSVEADRVSLLVEDGKGMLRTLSTYGLRRHAELSGGSFPVGEGVAGWCVEKGNIANLVNPRVDPRFISNDYNDIDSMLCCPLIPAEGEAIGAICAVNKRSEESESRTRFDEKDVRLFEGIARTIATALTAKDNSTRLLPRKMIQAVLAAQSF